MADKYPYVNGTDVLVQVLGHLKKSFSAKLNAEVLKTRLRTKERELYHQHRALPKVD